MAAILLTLLSLGFAGKMYAQPGPCLCLSTNGYDIINYKTVDVVVHYEVTSKFCVNAGSFCSAGCTITANGGVLNIPWSGFNANAWDIYIVVSEVGGTATTPNQSVWGCNTINCNGNTTNLSVTGTPAFTINWYCDHADIL